MKKVFQFLRIFFALAIGAIVSIVAFLGIGVGSGGRDVLFIITVIFAMAGSYMILFIFPGIISRTVKISRKSDEQV